MELLVFYEWSHPNPGQVLVYETEIRLNEEVIHKLKVPGTITNSSCRLQPSNDNMDDYVLSITAVDRCGQQSSNSTHINITSMSSSSSVHACSPAHR